MQKKRHNIYLILKLVTASHENNKTTVKKLLFKRVIKQQNWKLKIGECPQSSLALLKELQIAILVRESQDPFSKKNPDVITRSTEVFLERNVSTRFSFTQNNSHYEEARLTNTIKSVSGTMSGQRWKSMLVNPPKNFPLTLQSQKNSHKISMVQKVILVLYHKYLFYGNALKQIIIH